MTADMGRDPYQWAVLRIVPRVEREEFCNAGVVLHCGDRDWLGARIDVDWERLTALAPLADETRRTIEAGLAGFEAAVAGHGAAGEQPMGRRFGWLTAPRSTVVQTGPVHAGLTADPAVTLDDLFVRHVAT